MPEEIFEDECEEEEDGELAEHEALGERRLEGEQVVCHLSSAYY